MKTDTYEIVCALCGYQRGEHSGNTLSCPAGNPKDCLGFKSGQRFKAATPDMPVIKGRKLSDDDIVAIVEETAKSVAAACKAEYDSERREMVGVMELALSALEAEQTECFGDHPPSEGCIQCQLRAAIERGKK